MNIITAISTDVMVSIIQYSPVIGNFQFPSTDIVMTSSFNNNEKHPVLFIPLLQPTCMSCLVLAHVWSAELSNPFCQSVGLLVCQSVGLSVCQSVSLSVCPSVSLSVCRSVGLSVCWSVSLSVCQSVLLSVCQSAGLSVCQSVSLSVCQSVSLSFWAVCTVNIPKITHTSKLGVAVFCGCYSTGNLQPHL